MTAPRDGTPADPESSADEVWESTVRKDVLVGHQIGEYVIRRRIGSGGMGVVYEGEHPVIGRKVAIKFIRPDSSAGVHARDLVGEARAASAIRHRGIIDIFGFGTLPGIGQYLVMEFLNGRPLDEVIMDRAPIPPAEVIRFAIEMLGALSAAHAVGVIHRDLKPGNIFIVLESSGSEYVKVLDFGLAKQGATPHGVTPQTRASMIVGTPEYMAPEQACGQPVSPRTDLYAVGIILFEMLTGRLPFRGDSPMHVAIQQVQTPPPTPSSLVDGLPPELDALVLRLLAKDPEQRPASADAVERELKAISKTLAVEMTRLSGFARSIPEPTPKAPARSKRPAAPARAQTARPRPAQEPAPRTQLLTEEPPREVHRGAEAPDADESVRPPRSSWGVKLAVALGVTVLLIGSGVGLVTLRSNEGSSVPRESAPLNPVVVLPPTPKEDPKETTVSRQQPPPPVNPPDSQSGTKTPEKNETSAPPKSNTASAQQKEPKTGTGKSRRIKGNGTLKLVAECWAQVFVDGTYLGKAPRPPIALSAGKHTLELRDNPRVLEQRREIFIPPSETLSHTITCGIAGSSG